MRHNFIEAARRESATLPEGYERTLLDYLRFEAVGRANAKSWTQIDEHLRSRGHVVLDRHFQQGLLKRSREGDFYIGSADDDPRGYFLIETIHDANVMLDFYQGRINTETTRRNALRRWVDEPVPEGVTVRDGGREVRAILHQRPTDPVPYIAADQMQQALGAGQPVVMTPQGMVNAQQYAETYWHQADARAANAYGLTQQTNPYPAPTAQQVVDHMTPEQRTQVQQQIRAGARTGANYYGEWRFINGPSEPIPGHPTASEVQRENDAMERPNPDYTNPATGVSAELDANESFHQDCDRDANNEVP